MTTDRPETAGKPMAWIRTRACRWVSIAAILAMVAFVFRGPLFRGNFSAVDPGRVYRSAQPSAGFEASIRHFGFKSVLNLRGGNRFNAFYREECEVAERLGVAFYDLPLSATKRPSRKELMMALAVIERGPYPLLIHCKWGSDRTGMVSALYRMVVRGEPPERAIAAFSIEYGHIPFFGPQKLHEPFHEYADWLKTHNAEHNAQLFRDWLARDYDAPDPFTGWPTIEPGPRRIAAVIRP